VDQQAAPTPIYPLSLRLRGRRAVVVGGGSVAVRRVAGLRAAEADVLVVAPALSPTLSDLAARGLIAARQREYEPGDLDGAWLALACTDRPEVNAAVAAEAERSRIWCVRADDAEASDAWVPAVGRSGGDTVAVNAGRNPRRAARLRDLCMAAVAAARPEGAAEGGPERTAARVPGRVSIVGGGPGDPGLITVAARQRLAQADVVIADRLAPLELLDELAPEVQIIDAAKVPGGPAMRQDQINGALVEHARAGQSVVRLKGGDPFVFGRGREEVEACLAAGVPVEVIPGVTSAIAVPAAAGIPVTHRGLSQGFCVVAGHASPSDTRNTTGWAALARTGLTLVLLMGVEHLADTAQALLAAGLDGKTPGACVSDGWSRNQRVVTAPLAELAGAVSGAGITNPAVIVIGDVAQLGPGSPGNPAPPGPGSPGTPAVAEPAGQASRQASRQTLAPHVGQQGDDLGHSHTARRVLVLGGARSGKSAAAEGMLAGARAVDYIATGEPAGSGDAEWDARVREHQQRRPAQWRTVETLALEDVLAEPVSAAPALVDCLTVWLARAMDEVGAWDGGPGAAAALAARLDRLVAAWQGTRRQVVAVSNEIGAGVVPETASGRLFRDELGRLNARIAAGSDEVWYCTAGIARRLR
jgi:uroporphyrin-III C-methyltransferase/precorrin-2 dehydrogenase/sirohydrochlorin ferrochelatase